jgi:methylated-DNA-[protein]-cysteine S-methyltransferase
MKDKRTSAAYCVFDTALGACGIAWGEHGLTHFQLPQANAATTEARLQKRCGGEPSDPPPPWVATTIGDIQRYMRGERVDFSSAILNLSAVEPFDCEVYRAARAIGWGETTSYGELARLAGCAGEAREVGRSLGLNPLPVIVPCHRILAKQGSGGFSAYGGTFTKAKLLSLERLRVTDGAPLLPGL